MNGMIDELLDLLEAAFHEGLIDGEQLSLASAWIESSARDLGDDAQHH
jgi:hypothetical protein